jgi:hypothetical protein
MAAATEERRFLDIAHISFLEMIKAFIEHIGGTYANGALVRTAINAASRVDSASYGSWREFLDSVEQGQTPLATIEGAATYVGNGVFSLRRCPFAGSIDDYKAVFKEMPEGYAKVVEVFNRATNEVSERYRVGNGAGVSPFCSVHQPMRSATGDRMTVAGRPIVIYQLGCKAASGAKGFADRWIVEAGASRDAVSAALDSNMCCYKVAPRT